MDHLDEHLALAALSPKYKASIRAALSIGKKTLNCYYDQTDHSELYQIMMSMAFSFFFLWSYLTRLTVLHPRHKLQYF